MMQSNFYIKNKTKFKILEIKFTIFNRFFLRKFIFKKISKKIK